MKYSEIAALLWLLFKLLISLVRQGIGNELLRPPYATAGAESTPEVQLLLLAKQRTLVSDTDRYFHAEPDHVGTASETQKLEKVRLLSDWTNLGCECKPETHKLTRVRLVRAIDVSEPLR